MTEIPKCHKCGCIDKRLYHHHKSYNPEIVVLMCWPCHQLLHKKLRKNNRCTIPVDKIRTMSNNSKNRLEYIKRFYKTEKGKLIHNKTTRKYHDVHNRYTFRFTETQSPNVRLLEDITTYDQGRLVNIYSRFFADNGHKLIYIDIK
jgi:hypothetical protein